MSDLENTLKKHAERRRAFLRKSGNAAAAAPAVALLLQAGVKPAFAANYADIVGNPAGPTATVTVANPITVTTGLPIITTTFAAPFTTTTFRAPMTTTTARVTFTTTTVR